MDFDQTWYILSPWESGTLLIFKVKGQGHRVKLLGEGIHHALRCPCSGCVSLFSCQFFSHKNCQFLHACHVHTFILAVFCFMSILFAQKLSISNQIRNGQCFIYITMEYIHNLLLIDWWRICIVMNYWLKKFCDGREKSFISSIMYL